MKKLIRCLCGCGELRRAPLPPLAERARRRRINAEQAAKMRDAIVAALRQQVDAQQNHERQGLVH